MEATRPSQRASDRALRGRAFRRLWGSSSWYTADALRATGFKTEAQAWKALEEWYELFPQPWTRDKIVNAVIEFFKANKRWPRSRDWRTENGLPSWGTLCLVFDTQVHQPWTGGWRRTPRRWGKSPWVEVQEMLAGPAYRSKLTADMVLALPNITARRQAMDNFGHEKLLKSKSCTMVAKDEYGKLWRFGVESGYLMLEVINSTPEPDGSFAHYFLRVPHTMTCPKQAVAWTFGITEGWENYEGGVET